MVGLVEDPNGWPAWQSAGPVPLEQEIRARFLDGPFQLGDLWPGDRFFLGFGARMALRPGASEPAAQLGAELLVVTRHDAVEIAPDSGRARVVLAASALVYARCRSYRDSGMVKGSIWTRDEKPFMTAFKRSGPFRFEFSDDVPFQTTLSTRYVVWGKEPEVHSWWTIDPNRRGLYRSINMAISGPSGVSGGSAADIPMQLTRTKSRITNMESPDITKRESFDGHDCYVIRGIDWIGLPVDVWIDSESFLLRKIHRHWEYPSTTVYRPELDVEIPDDLFTFDPASPGDTPLGDGESVAAEMKPLAGDPREGAVLVPPEKRRMGQPQ